MLSKRVHTDPDNQAIYIKRIPFWKIIWFLNVTIKIHIKDPIFRRAMATTWNKIKFYFSFGWKLLWQHRFAIYNKNDFVGALSIELRKHLTFIYAVGVLQEYRHQGYGTKLMSFAEDFTRDHNRDYVCFSVLLANKPALSLYKKLNYKSQGIGLTLIRFLRRVLVNSSAVDSEKQYDLSFRLITNRKKMRDKTHYWWAKEIEVYTGKELCELSQQDNLLSFDFKRNWRFFEILTDKKPSGIMAILPSDAIYSLIIFSDPDLTWNLNWTFQFLTDVLQKKLGKTNNFQTYSQQIQSRALQKEAIINIFLTHQHKNALKKPHSKNIFIHESTEDRQIFYKKVV
jgi:ribosomal protein S18 acetylase RimI-like enzyme